jgi:hypothetical protein
MSDQIEDAVKVLREMRDSIHRIFNGGDEPEAVAALELAIAALSAREGGEAVGVVGPVTRGYSRVTLFNGDLPDGTELFLHPAQPASQQGAIGEIVARPYGYGVEWLVSPAPAIGTKLYASQQGEKDFEFGGYCGTCGSPCDDEGRSIHASQQAHPTGDKVRVTDEMVERMFTKARGYDCFFMFDNETLRRCVTQWLAAALDQEKGR